MHGFEPRNALADILAVEAVDYAGRGASPVEQDLKADNRRIRIR
ncbi:hypothetical protein ABID21_000536 [Pseudorhizobium tarimense]|uniref:Transposase n=1 Tax=Pseudorhizobium tarimense TaxID=1079109 RepID=A0ABV2H1P0_9HYPH